MAEPERIPCCIVGCGRTFKRQAKDGPRVVVMCGKHYRCDKELLRKRKTAEKRMRQLNTIHRRLVWKQGDITLAQETRLDRIWAKLDAQRHALWEQIRACAQDMEFTGFWARPRRSRRKNVEKLSPSPFGDKFEEQFQRLKKGKAATFR